MKKYKLAFVSLLLCFVFSITLFSNESASGSSNESSIESEKKDERKTEKNISEPKSESQQATSKVTVKENDKKEEGLAELKGDPKMDNAKTEKKRDAEISSTKDEPKKSKEKKEDETKDEEDATKVVESPDFSSIQVSGLTVCKGTNWYFEEYDEQGNVVGSVSYDRRKLLEKSSIEYSDGKKVAATFIDPPMIVKVRYNSKGVEIEREEFENENGQIGKPLNSSSDVYDDEGNILEETEVENGIITRHVYTDNGKEKATETIYEDGKQTLFIEYGKGKKTVHIFNEGEEVAVFDEETD